MNGAWGGTVGKVLPLGIARKLHVAQGKRVQVRHRVGAADLCVERDFQRSNGSQQLLRLQGEWLNRQLRLHTGIAEAAQYHEDADEGRASAPPATGDVGCNNGAGNESGGGAVVGHRNDDQTNDTFCTI